MDQDFPAFEMSEVLENFHKKMEVLEVLNDQLLAGLGDGSLIVLEPGKDNDGKHWQVVKALKNFGQRRIIQLQVVSFLVQSKEAHSMQLTCLFTDKAHGSWPLNACLSFGCKLYKEMPK